MYVFELEEINTDHTEGLLQYFEETWIKKYICSFNNW